jgi:hypothetical protein
MKYLVLMAEEDAFEKWAARSEAEQAEHFACFERFSEAVAARGTMLGGEGLDRPETARTVRPGDGARRPVTEGPYAETVEQLGGFFLVDLPDLDTAVELARLLPAPYHVEVRPVTDEGG